MINCPSRLLEREGEGRGGRREEGGGRREEGGGRREEGGGKEGGEDGQKEVV